jgi:hypothetical protein
LRGLGGLEKGSERGFGRNPEKGLRLPMEFLEEILEETFERARRKLYYPPIERFEVVDGMSEFHFGRRTKLIIGREDLVANKKALEGFFALNLNHWARHPYDLKTVLLEEFWLKDFEKRSEIRDLFDDFVSALDLIFNRGIEEVIDYYRHAPTRGKQDVLMRAYLQRVSGERIVKASEEIESRVDELMKIDFLDLRRIRLRMNIVRFAKVVDDLIEGFEPKIKVDKIAEDDLRQAMREAAWELDDKEYEAFCMFIGKKTDTEMKKPRKLWYMERARKYSIYIQPLAKTGSIYPSEIKEFEFDDGIESYNPVESYGKLIPGIAKKFVYEDFEGISGGMADAVIVMDSSGSMTDPEKEVSYAVLGAFVIARNYLENGARVGVVNFSNRNISLPPTRSEIVFDHLILYQGGGTHLDVHELGEYLKRIGTQVDLIMITDGGIENIEEVEDFISRLRSLTLIWIKRYVNGLKEFRERIDRLKRIRSVDVFDVENEADIPSMAVRRFGDFYG